MPLPVAPSQITHSDIMAEFGATANTEWKLSADGAAYINFAPSTIIKESDFYGASATVPGGRTWTYAPGMPPVKSTKYYSDCAINSNTGLVIAQTFDYGSKIFKSADFGETWTELARGNYSKGDMDKLNCICYSPTLDKFCSVGKKTALLSKDGTGGDKIDTGWDIIWPQIEAIMGQNSLQVIWCGSHFLTVGKDNSGAKSTDGRVWSECAPVWDTNISAGKSWYGAGYHAATNTILCGGEQGCMSMSKNNGSSWTPIRGHYDVHGTSKIYTIAVTESGRWVVGSSGFRCAWSDNGTDWNDATQSFQDAMLQEGGSKKERYALTWSGSEFYAVGEGGTAASSSDGINWTWERGPVSSEDVPDGKAVDKAQSDGGNGAALGLIYANDRYINVNNVGSGFTFNGVIFLGKK